MRWQIFPFVDDRNGAVVARRRRVAFFASNFSKRSLRSALFRAADRLQTRSGRQKMTIPGLDEAQERESKPERAL